MINERIKEVSKIIIESDGEYLNAEGAFNYWFKEIGCRDSLLLLGCEMLSNADAKGLNILDAYSMECAVDGLSAGFTEFLIFSGYVAQILQKEKGEAEKSVYVIELDNSSVKIGVTQNILSRFNQISNASGMTITKSYASPKNKNAFKIEKMLHEEFKDFRKDNGEFFNIKFQTAVECLEKILKDLAYLESA